MLQTQFNSIQSRMGHPILRGLAVAGEAKVLRMPWLPQDELSVAMASMDVPPIGCGSQLDQGGLIEQ
ncbi:MAG: hypothetical protein Q6L60_08930 [Thermostichus sp. HHBFW_bins_43]